MLGSESWLFHLSASKEMGAGAALAAAAVAHEIFHDDRSRAAQFEEITRF
jgi:hypothetical protein